MDGLKVIGDFESGSPQGKDAISRITDNAFLVKPFCEDDQVNYKFRLDVIINNESLKTQSVDLVVDWNDTTHSRYRDTYYAKGPGSEWQAVHGIVQGALTRLSLSVQPGKTHLSLNPNYSYSRYIDFVDKFSSRPGFSRMLLYSTERGREVHVLSVRTGSKASKRILITARTHPYESAGSYNIEGIVEGVAKMGCHGRLKGYELWIVPMVCPDGVADGLCRLNRVGSPDLSREINIHDDLSRAYMALLDEIKPHLFLEFHSWMLREHDGIFYLSAIATASTILRMRMRTSPRVRKPWLRGLDHFVIKRKPLGLKQYAEEQIGAKSATVEFPWFNRSPDDMKMLGFHTLLSMVPIV